MSDALDLLRRTLRTAYDSVGQSGNVLSSIPSTGAQALVLGELCDIGQNPVLFVAQDDKDLLNLEHALSCFSPNRDYLTFPAWDCRPFDGMSPARDVQAQRAYVLSRLYDSNVPQLILTTVNAVLQAVPKQSIAPQLRLRAGDQLDPIAFREQAHSMGYQACDTTLELGDFSLRGGIIDLFPPGSEHPFRIDLFGETIETIRLFDAHTQRTCGSVDQIDICPVREWSMNSGTQTTFISAARRIMGRDAAMSHPWVVAMESGVSCPGIEHALPLMGANLCPLMTLLDDKATMILGLGVQSNLGERHDHIQECLAFFKEVAKDNPLLEASADLYLSQSDFDTFARPAWRFVGEPMMDSEESVNLPFSLGHDYSLARRSTRALDEAVSVWKSLPERSRMTVICHSRESRQGVQEGLDTRFDAHDGLSRQSQGDDQISRVILCDSGDVYGLPSQLGLAIGPNIKGFRIKGDSGDWLVNHESDLFGQLQASEKNRTKRRAKPNLAIRQLQELCPGDILVDEEYGIGSFESLETVQHDGIRHDCVKLIYAGGDRLYVPVESLDRLSRYSFRLDAQDSEVNLDRLGAASWQQRKARTREDLLASAHTLIQQAAQRQLGNAPKLLSDERLDRFSAGSGFLQTDDQQRTIKEVLEQLATDKPSERLVSGDAGYGKTEVALHASFVAAMQGYQVLLLAPTTLLVRQHVRVFERRFRGWPVRIAELSRLVPTSKASAVRESVASGEVNIIIGTHALLSPRMRFNNIGLIIIDEEQHFGVKQKEILKGLSKDSHVLTLTATPIPRTLQLAISGMQDLSILSSPPQGRLGTRCFLSESDNPSLRGAIRQELDRDGQVFYVCPHISDLAGIAKKLRKWIPATDFTIAHGQMPAREMEYAVQNFVDYKVKLLLSTPIVESGLDIPRANTIIVHRADRFGISQLYQLRGRVGRGKERGWCYLTTLSLAPRTLANRRLETLARLQDRGMGLNIAAHDLDARGSGNLLGEQQSGHIREIGVELYQKMLREVLTELRSGGVQASENPDTPANVNGVASFSPSINLGVNVFIEPHMAREVHLRMNLYREASRCTSKEELDELEESWNDRFGALPEPTRNIFRVLEVKLLCMHARVSRLDAGVRGGVIQFHDQKPGNIDIVLTMLKKNKKTLLLRSDMSVKITRNWRDHGRRLVECKDILRQMTATP